MSLSRQASNRLKPGLPDIHIRTTFFKLYQAGLPDGIFGLIAKSSSGSRKADRNRIIVLYDQSMRCDHAYHAQHERRTGVTQWEFGSRTTRHERTPRTCQCCHRRIWLPSGETSGSHVNRARRTKNRTPGTATLPGRAHQAALLLRQRIRINAQCAQPGGKLLGTLLGLDCALFGGGRALFQFAKAQEALPIRAEKL